MAHYRATQGWVFAGSPHTTTGDATTGPEAWDSGVLSTGVFTHTFTTIGNWPYYCALHSFPGGSAMNGVVRVVAAAPTLTGVNPSSGTTAGGTAVTLTGTNFAGASGVGAIFITQFRGRREVEPY